jgi:hypothetical protein
MTTSGVIAGLDTAAQIVTDALIELQVYGANKTLTPADGELGRRRLNWMLKEQDTDGAALWRWVYDGTLTIPANAKTVLLAPRMVDVMDAVLVQDNGNERSLARREWGEFFSYPNKATPGDPTIFVPRPGRDSLTLQFWPVPTVDRVVNFTGARVSEDVVNLTDNIDVPQAYTRTVMMNLAAALAPAFGKANDENAVVTIREAARLRQIMRATDRPASYFMQSAGGAYGR